MIAIVIAVAVAVIVGNVAMVLLSFVDRPDQRDRWR